jgi:hypothetical protein
MSNEDADKVESYIESKGYTVRTSAGGGTSAAYGVKGIPDSVLIGPDGVIVWRGHPASLSTGTIEDALKDAKKPSDAGFMAVTTSLDPEGPLEKAIGYASEGELAKALKEARGLADDDSAEESVRADAGELADAILAHADMLNEQAAKFVERLDLVKAIQVYEAVADELDDFEAGKTAEERLKAIEKDDKLQDELEAQEAYEKLKKRVSRLSTSKKRKQFEKFADKYAGTKAAEKAQAWVRAN